MNPHGTLFPPGDINEIGAYWYFDDFGGPAQLVEIGDEGVPREDWEVRFPGRADADLLNELAGFFVGPIPRPARPSV